MLTQQITTPDTDREARLLAEGWLPGPPAHVQSWAQAVDARVVAESECVACGTVGPEFRPMHRRRRYIALAVCHCCGHQEEV